MATHDGNADPARGAASASASASTSASMPAPPPTQGVLGRALRGGSYLFLQKLVTFAINSFILRRLHLAVTGAVTVQFELALASMFLFRDAFRLAFLRVPSQLDASIAKSTSAMPPRQRRQLLVNVTWLSTLVSWGIAGAIIAVSMTRERPQPDSDQQDMQQYQRVLVMYCVAAMLEALAEPMYLLAHSSVMVAWQVSAQGAGFIMRAAVQYVGIFALHLDGLLSYGLAEIAYATTLLLVFVWFFYWKLRENRQGANTGGTMQSLSELLPARVVQGESRVFFDREVLSLLVPLSVQSVVKYLLTEGDKWVLSLFTTLQQMGVYGIVFHLGSLVPRILFLPLEEATKTISSKMSTARDQVEQTLRFIRILLKLMHLIGFTFVCFGVNYAQTAVLLLYGVEKARSGVGSALAMYCVYIMFLGMNGICEAFVQATGSHAQLMRLNQLMAVFFAIYAASALLFLRVLQLETVGIILANCVNMACRILYCMAHMASFFARSAASASTKSQHSRGVVITMLSFWRQTLPDCWVLASFANSFLVGATSYRIVLAPNVEAWWRHGVHVAIGGVCFAVVALTLFLRERKLLIDQVRQLRRGDLGADSESTKAHTD